MVAHPRGLSDGSCRLPGRLSRKGREPGTFHVLLGQRLPSRRGGQSFREYLCVAHGRLASGGHSGPPAQTEQFPGTIPMSAGLSSTDRHLLHHHFAQFLQRQQARCEGPGQLHLRCCVFETFCFLSNVLDAVRTDLVSHSKVSLRGLLLRAQKCCASYLRPPRKRGLTGPRRTQNQDGLIQRDAGMILS